MARRRKLLRNLAVLLLMLRDLCEEASRENSPWWGCLVSLAMLFALVRQHLCVMSCMQVSEVPMISSAVLTALCRDFQPKHCTLQAPEQTDMQQTVNSLFKYMLWLTGSHYRDFRIGVMGSYVCLRL